MTLAHFLSVLRARWRLAVAVLAVTVSAALAGVLVMRPTYTASAALLIDVSRPDPVTGLSNGGNPSPAILATQVGVLRSERVAREVVHRLGLASDEKARADWMAATKGHGDFESWLAQALQKKTEILPERDANVVAIDAKAGTPELAARIADTFAQVYLDVSAQVRADAAGQASSFFGSRADEARQALARAQARLAEFQRTNGVVVSDVQVDSESTPWLLATGHSWAALGLAAWGTVLIHPIDNILRPWLVSDALHLPFLWMLLGLLGGLASFGLLGLVLGPMILAVAWEAVARDADASRDA